MCMDHLGYQRCRPNPQCWSGNWNTQGRVGSYKVLYIVAIEFVYYAPAPGFKENTVYCFGSSIRVV
jgi:hypothetical protein